MSTKVEAAIAKREAKRTRKKPASPPKKAPEGEKASE
jgi:hypothetical protein